MDKTIVGNNAGKVWCALKEIGEISIPELARRLNLSVESTALAAGLAYRYTGRNMPEKRKKSWSSIHAALLRLYTSTQMRLPVSLMYGVRSNSEGVKLSSA